MQGFWVIALLAVCAHAALELQEVGGTNAGYGLSVAASGFSSTASSALAFINAAGVNKIIVATEDAMVVVNDGDALDVTDAINAGSATSVSTPEGTTSAQDLASLGNDIFLTEGTSMWKLNSDGSVHGNCAVATFSEPVFGAVGNPTNGKLFVGSQTGVRSFHAATAVLEEPVVLEDTQQHGIALSASYQTYYVAQHDLSSDNDDLVTGFSLFNGNPIEVFRSSNVENIRGVIAGTGCLSDYVFVSAGHQLVQISFRGVQTVIASDPVTSNSGGYLKYDGKDGSLLVPWGTSLYRLTPPTCGGFAGPQLFVADAWPVGTNCVVDSDCASQHCAVSGSSSQPTCLPNGYLGTCQTNDDCDSPTEDGYFCQLPLNHPDRRDPDRHHHGRGKRSRKDDEDFRPPVFVGPGVNPALYGVCLLNLCVVNHGGCDTDAECFPIGDRTRSCQCHPGYFGSGEEGQCVNPCQAINNGCSINATCVPVSSNEVRCVCEGAYWGVGTDDNVCKRNPCAANSGLCGSGLCTPTGENDGDFFCTCDEGHELFVEANPQCVINLCELNHPCPANAFCTPGYDENAFAADFTCECDAGYVPSATTDDHGPVSCTPAVCSIEIGQWPLADPHSSLGNCANAHTGQACFFGCMPGYKASSSTRAVCLPSLSSPTEAVFRLTPYACVRDEHDHDHDDDDNNGRPRRPWRCGAPLVACSPSAPWLDWKDRASGAIKLLWWPLGGTSPSGDRVDVLRLEVNPRSGASFTTSSIPNAVTASTWTVTGLTRGQTYTFRLLVTTPTGLLTGDSFTVEL